MGKLRDMIIEDTTTVGGSLLAGRVASKIAFNMVGSRIIALGASAVVAYGAGKAIHGHFKRQHQKSKSTPH